MIAIDTSSIIAYLEGLPGRDAELMDDALRTKQAVLPPVVLTELLSDPHLSKSLAALIQDLPVLDISEGYWKRAATQRSKVIAKGRKARIADALITQSCLDHRIALITRDTDFKAFAQYCGLVLAA